SQLSAFDLLQPNDKSKLIIDNGMLYNNLFKWESSTDQLGLETKYEFKLLEDSAGSFVEKYNRELSLDSTFLSEFQIDSIFTSIGLNQNDTFNGFWEVKAKTSLDSRSSLNGPFEISIYRGTYVGLEIKDQNHRINLFPNPNKGELYVESSLSEFELKIYDLNGRLQFQDRIKSANKKLDINSLKSGLYLIRIDSDTKSWTRKLFLDK
ncbi:MAG: T9SS type A sorting domain-containing protein, partial [Cytophagales bacterium]